MFIVQLSKKSSVSSPWHPWACGGYGNVVVWTRDTLCAELTGSGHTKPCRSFFFFPLSHPLSSFFPLSFPSSPSRVLPLVSSLLSLFYAARLARTTRVQSWGRLIGDRKVPLLCLYGSFVSRISSQPSPCDGNCYPPRQLMYARVVFLRRHVNLAGYLYRHQACLISKLPGEGG